MKLLSISCIVYIVISQCLEVNSIPVKRYGTDKSPRGKFVVRKRPTTDWSKHNIPVSSQKALEENMKELLQETEYGKDILEKVAQKFKSYGLVAEIKPHFMKDKKSSKEILWAVMKGHNYGTSEDEVTVVGTSYFKDNLEGDGSGLSAMLEIAKAMKSRCKLKNSVIFVAFDQDMNDLTGSKHFLSDYLVPQFEKSQMSLKATFILDSLMNFNDEDYTQEIPDFLFDVAPGAVEQIVKNNRKGNFLQMISKEGHNTHIVSIFKKIWATFGNSSMKLMNINLQNPHPKEELSPDGRTTDQFYPIILTDTAGYRQSANKLALGGELSSKEANLRFLKKTVDVMIETLNILGEGVCGFISRQNDKSYFGDKKIYSKLLEQKLMYKKIAGNKDYNARVPRRQKRETEAIDEKSNSDEDKELRQVMAFQTSLGANTQTQPTEFLSVPLVVNGQQTPPTQRPGNYIDTQGSYVLPDSAVLAAPVSNNQATTTTMTSTHNNGMLSLNPAGTNQVSAQSGVLSMNPVSSNQGSPPNIHSFSLEEFLNLQNQQGQFNVQPQTAALNFQPQNTVQNQQQSPLANLLNAAPDAISSTNLAASQINPQRMVRVPAGLLLAKNAYLAFANGMRRIVPNFG